MTAHEVYALIWNGIVQNTCEGHGHNETNRVAKAVYGDDAFAVDCLYCPCQKGDTYADGTFYAPDGTARPWLPTPEQQIAQLQAENQELTLALADMIGGAAV